jgi:hypothetical protein
MVVERVRRARLIGQGKRVGAKPPADRIAVYEAQWQLACRRCRYSITPSEWFTLHPRGRGDATLEPVCRHCVPFADVRAASGGR